jgi:Coenzyme PQQ synthesis protein D (PqqD)
VSEILPTAAYVRAANLKDAPSALHSGERRAREASARIWDLLQTPQTIETLCRVLASEFGLSRDRCSEEVRAVLGRLYAQGLIQVSPDT